MKYLVLSIFTIILGWNFYLFKSDTQLNSYPDKQSPSPSVKPSTLPTQKLSYESSPSTPKPIWENPTFKNQVDNLSHVKPSSQEIIEEQIKLKAQNIIKNKLDQYIGTQNHPELKRCRNTIAYRELTHSLMALIKQHGYSDLDFIENSAHIDFQELFFEHQMEPTTILSICANSLYGTEKETITRRIASLAQENAQSSSSHEKYTEDSPKENTLEPTSFKNEDEYEGDNN